MGRKEETRKKKDKALSLYLTGLGSDEISKKTGIPDGTIKCWMYREKWKDKLTAVRLHNSSDRVKFENLAPMAQIIRESNNELFRNITTYLESNTTRFMKFTQLVLDAAEISVSRIIDGGEENVINNIDRMSKITRMVKDAASVQNMVMPEGNEEVMESMLKNYNEGRRAS